MRMTRRNFDFRGTGDDFETPEPGVYTAEIVEVKETTTKDGDPRDVFTFEIRDDDFYGSRVWEGINYTKKTFWRYRQLLEAAGMEFPDDPSELKDVTIDLEELVGKLVRIQVKNRVYEGETQADVEKFAPAESQDVVTEEESAANVPF